MTDDQRRFEIPIERLPEGPIVRRSITEQTGATVMRAATEETAREETGPGALRPSAPEPVRSSRPRSLRPARFTDTRHPVRATAGLVLLVIAGSIALAVAIGVAIAIVAFAVRRAAG